MKWWQNFLRSIAKKFLEKNKQQLVDVIDSFTDTALQECKKELKAKYPDIPEGALQLLIDAMDDYVDKNAEKAIQELIDKLDEPVPAEEPKSQE